MLLRITNFRARIEFPESDLPQRAARAIGVRAEHVRSFKILRKSLDARQRDSLEFVYSLVVDVADAIKPRHASDVRVEPYKAEIFFDPVPGTTPLPHRPVIVGSGPAGLLAGYYLALHGYRPIILERGLAVKERVPAIRQFDRGGELDTENNYLFGEGRQRNLES